MVRKLFDIFLIAANIMVPLYASEQHNRHDFSRINAAIPTVGIAVIGSGPAGLTAAMYGAQSKLRTIVFAGPSRGGQIVGAGEVENMPGVPGSSGYEIMQTLEKQVNLFGADIVEKSVVALDLNRWPYMITLDSGEQVQALAVIVATGAAPRNLNVPGEETYWGVGVSACSICDCFIAQDKDVVIVGGGDSAAEHALNLNGYAKSLTILVRGEKMRASYRMQEKLRNYPNIRVLYGMRVVEVCGDGAEVTSVRVITADNTEEIIPCGAVFIAIGHNPNSALVAPFLELSKMGYIHLASRSQETAIRGVFAAGEVTDDRFRQATISAAQGAQAAREAVDFLRDIGVTPEYLTRFRSIVR
jgi:thioredoxin reductase (NADPH)